MLQRMHRTRIEDLVVVGEELSEAHLRLVSGASKKKQAGISRPNDGTCTANTTYYHPNEGNSSCETDGDED